MTTVVCGVAGDDRFPDAGQGTCCWGAVVYGASRCTCWEPVYDLEQQPVQPAGKLTIDGGDFVPADRPLMCGDCAYRPGSPERTSDERAAADAEHLEALAYGDRPFWCHQGIRRPIAHEHPTGEIYAEEDSINYTPPVAHGVPYRADGSPAEVCAGWTARRRAIAAVTETGGEK